MVQKRRPPSENDYGFSSPINDDLARPIIAQRDPTTQDTGYELGQEWINKVLNRPWILTSVVAAQANWVLEGAGVTPGVNTINATAAVLGNINLTNVGGLSIASGGAGIVNLGVNVDGVTIQIIGNQLVAAGVIPTSFVADVGAAVPAANVLNILGTAVQGITTAGAGNTITVSALDATAGQKGVASFTAANFTVVAGAVSSNPITVTSPLGTLSIGGSPVNLGGALTIDLAGGTVGADSFAIDAATAPGTNPTLPDGAGLVTITGLAVAAAAIPVRTNAIAANAFRVEVQRADDFAASLAANAGLASFNNTQFVVDANGWVSNLNGLSAANFPVQAVTAPGVSPVLPSAAGAVTISGATVASGVIPVQSRSIALNQLQIEVQRAGSSVGTNATQQGVASFNSAHFLLDANGWVSLAGGGLAFDEINVQAVTAPGVTPVLPSATGALTLSGAVVAASAIPIQSRSIALNQLQIEVQTSSAQVADTPTANGVAHFDSADFTVSATGFVSLVGGTSPWLDSAGGALVNHTGYFATAAAAFTLPAGVANGDMIEIVDFIGGGVVVTAQGGDLIRIGNVDSSVNGTATSTQLGDGLRLVFRLVGQVWVCVPGASGNWILA